MLSGSNNVCNYAAVAYIHLSGDVLRLCGPALPALCGATTQSQSKGTERLASSSVHHSVLRSLAFMGTAARHRCAAVRNAAEYELRSLLREAMQPNMAFGSSLAGRAEGGKDDGQDRCLRPFAEALVPLLWKSGVLRWEEAPYVFTAKTRRPWANKGKNNQDGHSSRDTVEALPYPRPGAGDLLLLFAELLSTATAGEINLSYAPGAFFHAQAELRSVPEGRKEDSEQSSVTSGKDGPNQATFCRATAPHSQASHPQGFLCVAVSPSVGTLPRVRSQRCGRHRTSERNARNERRLSTCGGDFEESAALDGEPTTACHVQGLEAEAQPSNGPSIVRPTAAYSDRRCGCAAASDMLEESAAPATGETSRSQRSLLQHLYKTRLEPTSAAGCRKNKCRTNGSRDDSQSIPADDVTVGEPHRNACHGSSSPTSSTEFTATGSSKAIMAPDIEDPSRCFPAQSSFQSSTCCSAVCTASADAGHGEGVCESSSKRELPTLETGANKSSARPCSSLADSGSRSRDPGLTGSGPDVETALGARFFRNISCRRPRSCGVLEERRRPSAITRSGMRRSASLGNLNRPPCEPSAQPLEPPAHCNAHGCSRRGWSASHTGNDSPRVGAGGDVIVRRLPEATPTGSLIGQFVPNEEMSEEERECKDVLECFERSLLKLYTSLQPDAQLLHAYLRIPARRVGVMCCERGAQPRSSAYAHDQSYRRRCCSLWGSENSALSAGVACASEERLQSAEEVSFDGPLNLTIALPRMLRAFGCQRDPRTRTAVMALAKLVKSHCRSVVGIAAIDGDCVSGFHRLSLTLKPSENCADFATTEFQPAEFYVLLANCAHFVNMRRNDKSNEGRERAGQPGQGRMRSRSHDSFTYGKLGTRRVSCFEGVVRAHSAAHAKYGCSAYRVHHPNNSSRRYRAQRDGSPYDAANGNDRRDNVDPCLAEKTQQRAARERGSAGVVENGHTHLPVACTVNHARRTRPEHCCLGRVSAVERSQAYSTQGGQSEADARTHGSACKPDRQYYLQMQEKVEGGTAGATADEFSLKAVTECSTTAAVAAAPADTVSPKRSGSAIVTREAGQQLGGRGEGQDDPLVAQDGLVPPLAKQANKAQQPLTPDTRDALTRDEAAPHKPPFKRSFEQALQPHRPQKHQQTPPRSLDDSGTMEQVYLFSQRPRADSSLSKRRAEASLRGSSRWSCGRQGPSATPWRRHPEPPAPPHTRNAGSRDRLRSPPRQGMQSETSGIEMSLVNQHATLPEQPLRDSTPEQERKPGPQHIGRFNGFSAPVSRAPHPALARLLESRKASLASKARREENKEKVHTHLQSESVQSILVACGSGLQMVFVLFSDPRGVVIPQRMWFKFASCFNLLPQKEMTLIYRRVGRNYVPAQRTTDMLPTSAHRQARRGDGQLLQSSGRPCLRVSCVYFLCIHAVAGSQMTQEQLEEALLRIAASVYNLDLLQFNASGSALRSPAARCETQRETSADVADALERVLRHMKVHEPRVLRDSRLLRLRATLSFRDFESPLFRKRVCVLHILSFYLFTCYAGFLSVDIYIVHRNNSVYDSWLMSTSGKRLRHRFMLKTSRTLCVLNRECGNTTYHLGLPPYLVHSIVKYQLLLACNPARNKARFRMQNLMNTQASAKSADTHCERSSQQSYLGYCFFHQSRPKLSGYSSLRTNKHQSAAPADLHSEKNEKPPDGTILQRAVSSAISCDAHAHTFSSRLSTFSIDVILSKTSQRGPFRRQNVHKPGDVRAA
ncbi:unnamed protein product [Rangifer tarandus platyrhynchus]|uniref:Uncharacterized protein n=1 Tax=Rangifer tarandus platyrhynchus TaxID=3082113 RepID=A0ABN8XIH1_RANTA|nr:unnamed protein product [Rangifer tarandus platyrhynchus]